MSRYKPHTATADKPDEENEPLAQNIINRETEDEQYRFDCLNVNIGVIGSTRRVGTTTTAIGLANYIKNHGGTACYVALNIFRHLESIAGAYGFDTEEDYYTYDAVDYYECTLPKYDYNFIITDYGDIKRETVRKFKDSDVHLFCGASNKRYEVMEFSEGLKAIRSVEPRIITYAPNPEYCQLFNANVTNEPIIIRPIRNMLDFKTNSLAFRGIIQKYIIETSKRL